MAKRYKFGVNVHVKRTPRNGLVDTRRGWIKDYQEERRVEVKVDADNFSIDIQNRITYNVG